MSKINTTLSITALCLLCWGCSIKEETGYKPGLDSTFYLPEAETPQTAEGQSPPNQLSFAHVVVAPSPETLTINTANAIYILRLSEAEYAASIPSTQKAADNLYGAALLWLDSIKQLDTSLKHIKLIITSSRVLLVAGKPVFKAGLSNSTSLLLTNADGATLALKGAYQPKAFIKLARRFFKPKGISTSGKMEEGLPS